jgi:SNF2 family DNA or RNA helicase
MGLGKTLTMLAAILHSSKTAEDFGNASPSLRDGDNTIPTKATLIVVPSTRKPPRVGLRMQKLTVLRTYGKLDD